MTAPNDQPASHARRRFQFSLGAVFLWTTIACLALSIVLLNGKLLQTRQELAKSRLELDSMRPLSFEEVARQFESQTSRGPIAIKVEEVRYSTKDDAYRIAFSWTDPATGGASSSEVRLNGDGFGVYRAIISGTLSTALGQPSDFAVAAKSESVLEK